MRDKVYIEEGKVEDVGSCNFCLRGYRKDEGGLMYPYEEVFILQRGDGQGLSANICKSCIMEIIKKVKI